jgi:hypothetical protein
MSKQHFNDDHDFTNDDGYLDGLLDDMDIPQEWLDEEEEYFSERELDPANEDEYDAVDEGEEAADSLDRYDEDFDWDGDTPIGLEYDGYNDPDNY